MGNLTADQLAAFKAGQPVKQRWWTRCPTSSSHAGYLDTLFEEGVHRLPNAQATPPTPRVTKAGKRKHVVWNPHPNVGIRATALMYRFEVANGDGMFNPGPGSFWNKYSIYDAAPGECFIVHKLYVWVNNAWSEITHMAFVGEVKDVDYSDSAKPDARDPKAAQDRAVITCTQHGVWRTLKRRFTEEDGDREIIDDDGRRYWLVVA